MECRMTKPIVRDPIYRRRVFNADIIKLCVPWYITYRLSYRLGKLPRPPSDDMKFLFFGDADSAGLVPNGDGRGSVAARVRAVLGSEVFWPINADLEKLRAHLPSTSGCARR